MANEIGIPGLTSGLTTVYAMVFNSVNQVRQTTTSSFVAWVSANRANYDVAMTELGTSGIYVGDMPAVPAGVYSVLVYQRLGGAPADGDTFLGGGSKEWNGTAEQALYGVTADVSASAVASVTATVNADVVKVNGTTVTGDGTSGNEWGP